MYGFDVAAVVLSAVFFRKLRRGVKPVIIILEVFTIALSIASFVLWTLAAAGVASYVLIWVAMGLTIGCFFFSVVTIALTFACRQPRQVAYNNYYQQQYQQQYYGYSQQQPQPQPAPVQNYNQSAPQNNEANLDYINEIKRLKELLDMNAISVEEFENKKKQLLGL